MAHTLIFILPLYIYLFTCIYPSVKYVPLSHSLTAFFSNLSVYTYTCICIYPCVCICTFIFLSLLPLLGVVHTPILYLSFFTGVFPCMYLSPFFSNLHVYLYVSICMYLYKYISFSPLSLSPLLAFSPRYTKEIIIHGPLS